MSEYLRATRSHTIGPVARRTRYATPIHYTRATVVVRQVTGDERRQWRRAVERFAREHQAKFTVVDMRGPHPVSGLPRTVAMSVSAPSAVIDAISRFPYVEQVIHSEALVSRFGSGTGPETVRWSGAPAKVKPPRPDETKKLAALRRELAPPAGLPVSFPDGACSAWPRRKFHPMPYLVPLD